MHRKPINPRTRLMRWATTIAALGALLLGSGVYLQPDRQAAHAAVTDNPAFPAHILIVGDSITVGAGTPNAGWRGWLADYIEQGSGRRPDVDYYAVGGWSTADAAPGFPAALIALRPDLVLFALGTNDSGDVTGGQLRVTKMLSAIDNMTTARFGVSFIEYSNPVTSGQANLPAGEAAVNDAWYRAYAQQGLIVTPFPARFAGFADLQAMSTGCLDEHGVHPSATGYEVEGAIWYRMLAARYGWPLLGPIPRPAGDPCQLNGHRP